MRGPDLSSDAASDALELGGSLTVAHRSAVRSPSRLGAAAIYAQARETFGVEREPVAV